MFTLSHIELNQHPILGDICLDLGDNADYGRDVDNIFTTVIIGENGIGKSYLLSAVVDMFRYLYALKYNEEIPSIRYGFRVAYEVDGYKCEANCHPQGQHYDIDNHARNYQLTVNGNLSDIAVFPVPAYVIASTMTVADKFVAKSSEHYYYRGIRNERMFSTTGTRTMVRKIVDGIAEALGNKAATRAELAGFLNELGFDASMEIRYGWHYRDVFCDNCESPERLRFVYEHQEQFFPKRDSEIWGTSYFKSLSEDKIEKVCQYLCRLRDMKGQYGKYAIIYHPFDLDDTLSADREMIRMLTNLDILTFPELKVTKLDDEYNFMESSSGEVQQFFQFINVLSAIKSNSLVLIDEPENSSHPNWQMSYVGWLRGIFKMYPSSHFIIATHSHFLLTDLEPSMSRIVALRKDEDDNKIIDVAEGVNTFCWSCDEILYKVFRVRNTRNRIFEFKLRELYQYIIAGTANTPEAQALLAELKQYRLSDNDPLAELLKMAEV